MIRNLGSPTIVYIVCLNTLYIELVSRHYGVFSFKVIENILHAAFFKLPGVHKFYTYYVNFGYGVRIIIMIMP